MYETSLIAYAETSPDSGGEPGGALANARAHAALRAVNERHAAQSGNVFDRLDALEFSCECGSAQCSAAVTLTRECYEEIRWSPTRFLAAPGHVVEGDRVVDVRPRLVVVAVVGEAAKIVTRPLGDPARAGRRFGNH